MHKPAQVELQLDRPQLLYSETLGPITGGGSPARYHRRQPNPAKKGPHIKLATPLGSWEANRGEGKESSTPRKQCHPNLGRHEIRVPCPHKHNLGQQRLIKNNSIRQKVPTEQGLILSLKQEPPQTMSTPSSKCCNHCSTHSNK